MTRGKLITFAAGISMIVICGISAWRVHRTYYFNPFTFKRDNITNMSWSYYRNPVELDIEYQSANGTEFRYTTQNRSKINYVLGQLKNGTSMSYHAVAQVPSRQTFIVLRNPVSRLIYLHATLHKNLKVALITPNAVTVTSELKSFIQRSKVLAEK